MRSEIQASEIKYDKFNKMRYDSGKIAADNINSGLRDISMTFFASTIAAPQPKLL